MEPCGGGSAFIGEGGNWMIGRLLQRITDKGVLDILAVIFAAAALGISLWTFSDTRETQAETAAVAALQEYFKLVVDNPELQKRCLGEGESSRECAWFASYALFTADTIDDLVGTLPGEQREAWHNTLQGIVASHATFILSDDFPCDEFDEQFIIEYIKRNDKLVDSHGTDVKQVCSSVQSPLPFR
jgi:hypothetical protein